MCVFVLMLDLGNATMAACQKGRAWRALFMLFSFKALQLDSVSFGTAVAAASWPLSISLMASMPAHRLVAELVAYNAAMATCLRFSCWGPVRQLLRAAEAAVKVDAETYALAMSVSPTDRLLLGKVQQQGER